MLQTQPVLSSPKAHGPAQQLGTPSSQPWKASSWERQLVTTTLGQGRSLSGQLLNTAATENLAKERNPSLFSLPKPMGQDGQCSGQLRVYSCPFPGCPQPCAIFIPPCPRQTAECRWLSLGAIECRELHSPYAQVPQGYTPDMHCQDGATVLTCPYAQFPSKCCSWVKSCSNGISSVTSALKTPLAPKAAALCAVPSMQQVWV